ncbi:hypothetical protein KXV95_008664 [Aspergillus fumigatus]|uniref:BTB domain-containing protein n=1 Tax=Aspergillus fumigatus (strain ATCC MYA-4609 / CBS 101355 / FGSC A1100 / Af293) TaxID=330879 RepID=Q4WFG9_ASPFU|nr:conserved hypothetical protein [Aspergillus fumigatus Af293]KAF4259250.1 hypothetical protein CNMCM8714_001759 [Aspergillus fumigatus]EAL86508.1 conserved hypothetical protein [Aspergillus fumigatus Af293]KAF4277798.1 hypothetical protein CNMCM8057_002322 [Aspergillus fumigatus]KAF4294688.1 hypothetical protein CNMCM8686_002465 [Aspergillus fumigatus]KAH1324256.1 hypothetical protein KXX66_006979 [Aspergillus fumigatus]
MEIDQVKPERHDIAPDGDLILLYKKHANRPVELRVSTTILKSQSIYFEALSGRWLETLPVRPDGLREMAFERFDPDAMLIIMKAAHLKFQGIPDELNVKLLHKIAKYVHMFDMFPAVCTLARPWIQYVRMFVDQCNSTELAGYLLGIMWVFNLKEQFKKATRSIVVDCNAVDIDLSRTLIDQSMFDDLLAIRHKLMRDMSSLIESTLIAPLKQAEKNGKVICHEECDHHIRIHMQVLMEAPPNKETKPSRIVEGLRLLLDDRKFYHNSSRDPLEGFRKPHCIGRLNDVISQLDRMLETVEGFDLADWRPEASQDVVWGDDVEPELRLDWPYDQKFNFDSDYELSPRSSASPPPGKGRKE